MLESTSDDQKRSSWLNHYMIYFNELYGTDHNFSVNNEMKYPFNRISNRVNFTVCGLVLVAALSFVLVTVNAAAADRPCPKSGLYSQVAPNTDHWASAFELGASLAASDDDSKVARDVNCYIRAETMIESRSYGNIVLVDIRPADDFARNHIPGSLNILPAQIQTKPFLHSKHLVLVDRGNSYAHLEALCRQLRASGMSQVSVLDGGLDYWHKRIAPLVGDQLAQEELVRFSPREYFVERKYAHWVVVDLAAAKRPAGYEDVNGLDARLSLDVKEIQAQLAAAADAHGRRGRDEPYLLVVTPEGEGFDAVLAALQEDGPVHTYFLDGGRAAYERFVRAQRAMLSYEHRIPKIRACGERI